MNPQDIVLVPLVPVVSIKRSDMIKNILESGKNLIVDSLLDRDVTRVHNQVTGMLEAVVTNDDTAIRAELRGGSTALMLGDKMDHLDKLAKAEVDFILTIEPEDGEHCSHRILISGKEIAW
jgi:hypothetical protein